MNPSTICGDMSQNVSENVFENATLGSILESIQSEKLKYLRNYKELKLDIAYSIQHFIAYSPYIYLYCVKLSDESIQ